MRREKREMVKEVRERSELQVETRVSVEKLIGMKERVKKMRGALSTNG